MAKFTVTVDVDFKDYFRPDAFDHGEVYLAVGVAEMFQQRAILILDALLPDGVYAMTGATHDDVRENPITIALVDRHNNHLGVSALPEGGYVFDYRYCDVDASPDAINRALAEAERRFDALEWGRD